MEGDPLTDPARFEDAGDRIPSLGEELGFWRGLRVGGEPLALLLGAFWGVGQEVTLPSNLPDVLHTFSHKVPTR